MTGIDMMLGVMGAWICLGCLTLSSWMVLQSIKHRDDELSSIFILASIPTLLAVLPIAWWIPAEAWVFTVTVYVVGAVVYMMRRVLEPSSY